MSDKAEDAAKKAPSARTVEEQQLVDRHSNRLSVKNADFKARQAEKTSGSHFW